ncbi:MAG: TolC family protein [Endomicrobium sp.]|jgi:outer membrane protein TolC|nr:TolC family protein [Endomicrobium sp.]
MEKNLLLNEKKFFKRFTFVLTITFLLSVLHNTSYSDDAFLLRCMKIAESRDPKLRVTFEQVQLAKSRTIRAARAFFPQIMLQHTNSKGTTALASNSQGLFDGKEYNSESYGIKATQAIYEGYRTRGTYKYESMMVAAAKFNYTKTREELSSKIKLAYYEYLTLKLEYKTLGKAYEIVDKLFLKVKNEYKAKAISELDMFEAENFKDKISDMYFAARINLDFSIKKLINIVGVTDISDINAQASDELSDDVAEISFTLRDLLSFVLTNNLDVQTAKIQSEMADMKIKINRSKIIPKFYVDGFYGKGGEAFTTEPLELAANWSVLGRLSWSLWGNSFEAAYSKEATDPSSIVDASKRVDTTTYDFKLALLDDVGYFVDVKESNVGFNQANADYVEILKTRRLETEKAYNDYLNSLSNARTLKKEIVLRERKLVLMRKRNALYEVPTVNLMEEAWKYAEAISSYARATYQNHSSVTEMERLLLIPLR